MSKPSFASEKVMRHYLDALLIDEEDNTTQVLSAKSVKTTKSVKPVKESLESTLKPVAKLLEKVNVLERTNQNIPVPEHREIRPIDLIQDEIHESPLKKNQSVVDKPYRQGEFQALFFEVAGLTLAVPLTELGGIHHMMEINNLVGKPDWFMGLMMHREHKFNIVNTAKWVMPEKYDLQLENKIEYQYIIMLDNSVWGLASEKLVNTVMLKHEDVKWKEHGGKRPWLAGLIKERMCALLDVSALITMLEQGLSTSDDLPNN